MITHIVIRNFKGFDEVEFELGDRVVFIGPNNSGKTTALQALALWDIGLKRWIEKRGFGVLSGKRQGVTINRRELVAVSVPSVKHLWYATHLREHDKNKKKTKNIRIEIIVKGIKDGREWECGLEFDYANEESFYCRPLRIEKNSGSERMPIPQEVDGIQVAYLPPMSGLTAVETRLDPGAINVRLAEGRTAEVLRNLCYKIFESEKGKEKWENLSLAINKLFGISIEEPEYNPSRGEILLFYKDERGTRLDITSSGRGLQQTILLIAHMTVNPGSILLLDEPDAHLEILRQRQIYQLLTDTAREFNNQLLAASHSEVILNEAADRDMVIAFVGKPHRIDDRGSQVLKSLKEIGYDQYYQAEETGWVLYLEGSTDLAVLRALAKKLKHPAEEALERPFVHYVANHPKKAMDHFYGLKEAKQDLRGIAIYDRLERELPSNDHENFHQYMWKCREIENYLCTKNVLIAWTEAKAEEENGPLFAQLWVQTMEKLIDKYEGAFKAINLPSPWGCDIKATDDFLDKLFDEFFKEVELPNLMRKTDYHIFADYIDKDAIDNEVIGVLDLIYNTSKPR